MTYWKILSMVYLQKTSNYMNGSVLRDIRNVSVIVITRILS